MSLYTEIQAVCSPAQIAEKNYHTIAALVNVGRVKTLKKEGGIGLIMATLGPNDGAALLDNLTALSATNSAVKWAMKLVDRGELDFGDTATRIMIDSLVAGGVMSVEQATALKTLAEVPNNVSWQECQTAVEAGV